MKTTLNYGIDRDDNDKDSDDASSGVTTNENK